MVAIALLFLIACEISSPLQAFLNLGNDIPGMTVLLPNQQHGGSGKRGRDHLCSSTPGNNGRHHKTPPSPQQEYVSYQGRFPATRRLSQASQPWRKEIS